MKGKKFLTAFLACIVATNCFCVTAIAAKNEIYSVDEIITRASARFSMEIPGNTSAQASSSFPLEAGESVTIKASYSPFSASVDFGLVAPDGLFYYVNVSNGSIDQAIEVTQRGNYTFAVRNNSAESISVSGYVNY